MKHFHLEGRVFKCTYINYRLDLFEKRDLRFSRAQSIFESPLSSLKMKCLRNKKRNPILNIHIYIQ